MLHNVHIYSHVRIDTGAIIIIILCSTMIGEGRIGAKCYIVHISYT